MTGRPSLTTALKDVAVRLAREAERYVGAQDVTPCAACSHPRAEHCGCGTVCLADDRACRCAGYSPRAGE